MAAVAELRTPAALPKLAAWLPLALLPATVALACRDWPPWLLMWMMAGALYAGAKWLTLAGAAAARTAPPGRMPGYLLLWPGMNAAAFLASRPASSDGRPGSTAEWAAALAKTVLGLLLVFGAAPRAMVVSPLAAGWLGMAGIVFILHFGLFHLLSLAWRRAGRDAPPIMQAPIRSRSLADFWGRRWNRAFRDVVHEHLFRPLLPRLGPTGATLAVFLVSGLVHELVISLPAGAGYGLPTLYFLIQGAGLLVERSRTGRRAGLGRGPAGRLFCAAVTVAPLMLLFHRPFVERAVLPMLAAIGAV